MPFPFQFQRITGGQAAAIARAHAGGATGPALAREYGVSVRTVFRVIRRAEQPVAAIVAGPWRASFVLTDEGPVQTEPWRAA